MPKIPRRFEIEKQQYLHGENELDHFQFFFDFGDHAESLDRLFLGVLQFIPCRVIVEVVIETDSKE